jgi:glycosyltransferase involved in cell wall biosynthesis
VLFSVVVPSWNRLALLQEALASIRAQTFTDYETLVVDDGSTDGTAETLEADRRLRLLRQANKGPGAARNLGARAAQGEYLAFLDSDDLWFPWSLQTFADAIARHGRPALLFGSPVEFRDEHPVFAQGGTSPAPIFEHYPDYFASSAHPIFTGTNVCVVRRDRLLAAGGFVETLRSAEDIDLFLRLGTQQGFVHVRAPHTLAYRRHGDALTTDPTATVAGASFLIRSERAERYPGGDQRARERREIITRSVRSVSISAMRQASLPSAASLYLQTFAWHLTTYRIKYLAGFWAVAVATVAARVRAWMIRYARL